MQLLDHGVEGNVELLEKGRKKTELNKQIWAAISFKRSSFVRSLFRSFAHSLALSFVRSFVCSFLLSFVCSFIRSFVPLLVRYLVRSFVRSLIRSFVRSLVRSFVRSLGRSFAHSVVRSVVRSFVRLIVRLFVLRQSVRSMLHGNTVKSLSEKYKINSFTHLAIFAFPAPRQLQQLLSQPAVEGGLLSVCEAAAEQAWVDHGHCYRDLAPGAGSAVGGDCRLHRPGKEEA